MRAAIQKDLAVAVDVAFIQDHQQRRRLDEFLQNGEIRGTPAGRQWPSGSSLLKLARRCL